MNENCIVEGCEKPIKVALRGMCATHYQAWVLENKPKGKKPCAVEGCGSHLYARGYCRNHYERWRKNGTPEAPPKAPCACGQESTVARGMCKNCYQRWYYWEGMNADLGGRQGVNSKPVVKYAMAHLRVVKAKGRARTHQCIDCGGPAKDWSLRHDAENVLIEAPSGRNAGSRYSLNTDDYEPRCHQCHVSYDAAHGNRKANAYVRGVRA